MVSSSGSNREDEYADDQYARLRCRRSRAPLSAAKIPDDEPEDDVLEQRREVPYGDDGQ